MENKIFICLLRHVSNVSTWGPQLATYQKLPYMPATWTQFKKTKTKKKNPLFGIWIIISLIVTRTKHMRSVWSEMYNWKCLWVVTADLLIAYLLLLHCIVRKKASSNHLAVVAAAAPSSEGERNLNESAFFVTKRTPPHIVCIRPFHFNNK